MIEFAKIVDVIGWALVHSVWQSAIVAVVLAILLSVTPKRQTQRRYFLSCVALFTCFVLPVCSTINDFSLIPSSGANSYQAGRLLVVQPSVVSSHGLVELVRQHLLDIVLVWSVVVGLLLMRFCLGLWWLHNTLGNCSNKRHDYWQQKIDRLSHSIGVASGVVLYIVKDLPSPITMGCLRPVILVPAALVIKMDPRLLEALLAHEIAHIKRYDYFVNFIQNIIEIVLFYHPVTWWISKHIRQERENIADDIAVSVLTEPRSLALALQELEAFQFSLTQPALAAHGGHLMSRIKRLVRPEKQAYSLKTILACVFAAITCIGVVAHASNRESVKPETHKFEKTQTSDAKMPIAGDGVVLDMRTSSELRPEKLIVTPSSQSPDKDLSSKSNAFHENPSATIESKVEILSPEKIEEIPQQNEKTYFFKAPKIDFTQATCRPEFPLSARRIAPSGVTRVQAMIGEDGRIQKVDIVSSSGFRMLDQAVREALLAPTCVGVPGTINGKAFTAQIRADFNWLGTVDNLGLSSQSLEVQSTLPSTRPANINFEASGCRPEYPANSRKNQEAGLTGLTVSINAEGIVTEARVNKSSGFRGLDNAVVTTLIAGNCKAQPSYVDGNAVHSVIDVSYLWKSN